MYVLCNNIYKFYFSDIYINEIIKNLIDLIWRIKTNNNMCNFDLLNLLSLWLRISLMGFEIMRLILILNSFDSEYKQCV